MDKVVEFLLHQLRHDGVGDQLSSQLLHTALVLLLMVLQQGLHLLQHNMQQSVSRQHLLLSTGINLWHQVLLPFISVTLATVNLRSIQAYAMPTLDQHQVTSGLPKVYLGQPQVNPVIHR